MDDRIKVIYIAGWGRSGSTLLNSILGQMDGFFSAGELGGMWGSSFIENRPCGCGSPFHECGVWQNIIRSAYGGFDGIDPHRMNRLFRNETRTIHMPVFFLTYGNSPVSGIRQEYLDKIAGLYRAIASVSGSRVIADSSKSPAYAAMLGLIPEIDLYLVHLIRDPKAVGYSWSSRKPKPGDSLRRMNPVKSSLLWNAWNGGTEILRRRFPEKYIRIRYEDFILQPRETVRKILALVQEDIPLPPSFTNHAVQLNPTHTVKGNPSRLLTGKVELIPDERWKKGMHPLTKGLVDAITWPLLFKYGYRL
jgi:hypothetical protein